MDERPMRCLFCHTPYRDGDTETVTDPASGQPTRIVYRCRVCESERTVSVSTVANIYGSEIAKRDPDDAARILRDQARRLEG